MTLYIKLMKNKNKKCVYPGWTSSKKEQAYQITSG